MINITDDYINSIASNNSAVQNAKGLVKKNSYVKLNKSEDESMLFGECKGSGKNNYITSADFIKPESPIFRCNCPSRQFPCKHALGLMYAYTSGLPFDTAEIPQDIQDKREKAEKRDIKKKEDAQESKPKKVNKAALAKKIKNQLEGLGLLEKISNDIVRNGFDSIDARALKLLEDGAKQLGNYYISGAQIALRRFILLFSSEDSREKYYMEALNQISIISSLAKKGKEYLNKRLEDPELSMDKDSTLEEWLGHAWQLEELRQVGKVEENMELLQLYFKSYVDNARKENVDLGIWINLNTGKLQATFNYRPFKAAKLMKEEDSFFMVSVVKQLFTYPGDLVPRVRWEEATVREINKEDFKVIRGFAHKSFADVIKIVKNQIKNPLADKNPEVLLKFSRIGKVGENYVVEDESGKRLILEDSILGIEGPTCQLLPLLKWDTLSDAAVLVRFENNLDTGKLRVQPLSIVTDSKIIRLVY